MDVRMYVMTHKKIAPIASSIYHILHVGKKGKEDLGYPGDDTGYNISEKNTNYCELTGAYWIEYNDKSDIVGLVHYRRYFFENKLTNKIKNIISKEKIENILNNYDIIVPKVTKLETTVQKHYAQLHHEKDLLECGKIIKEKFPDYDVSFKEVLESYELYTCNMFITKKELFDEYYKWLFEILFELENRVDISQYSDYDKRIYGFLSERLFNVWLKRKNLKIKELYVYNIDKNIIKQVIGNKISEVKGKISKWQKRA